MFKNGIRLKKSAWFNKLLMWMWKIDGGKYKNFCPLFWLIVGSITILPIYLIIIMPIIKLLNADIKIGDKGERCLIKIGLIIANVFKIIAIYFLTTLVSIILTYSIYWPQYIDRLSEILLSLLASFLIGAVSFLLTIGVCNGVSSSHKILKDTRYFNLPKKQKAYTFIYFITIHQTVVTTKKLVKVIKNIYNKNCPLIIWK